MVVDIDIVEITLICNDGCVGNIVGTSHTCNKHYTVILVHSDTDADVLDLVGESIRFCVHDVSGTRVAHVDGLSFRETRRVYTLYLTIRHRTPFLTGQDIFVDETDCGHGRGAVGFRQRHVRDVVVERVHDVDNVTLVESRTGGVVYLDEVVYVVFIYPIRTIIHEEMVSLWCRDVNICQLFQL